MENKEFKQLIAEAVLEELNNKNSVVAKLMLHRERRLDKTVTENIDEFIAETVDVLMEHLHLEKKDVVCEVSKEQKRMLNLAGLNESAKWIIYNTSTGERHSGGKTWKTWEGAKNAKAKMNDPKMEIASELWYFDNKDKLK